MKGRRWPMAESPLRGPDVQDFTAWRSGCHRLLPEDVSMPIDGFGDGTRLGSSVAGRDCAAASIRSRIRSPMPWQVLARAYACRRPARPSSECWARIFRTASINSSPFSATWNRSACKPALRDRRRDDRPARAHRVHDLGRVARPVERVVDAVGNQADVEGLIIARRARPAGASPGHGRWGGTGTASRLSHQGSSTASRTRPTTTIEASGNVVTQPVHQLPVDAVLQRADVAEIGAGQVARSAGARPAGSSGCWARNGVGAPCGTWWIRPAASGIAATALRPAAARRRRSGRPPAPPPAPARGSRPAARASKARSRRCCSRPTRRGEAGRAGRDNAGTTSPARAASGRAAICHQSRIDRAIGRMPSRG